MGLVHVSLKNLRVHEEDKVSTLGPGIASHSPGCVTQGYHAELSKLSEFQSSICIVLGESQELVSLLGCRHLLLEKPLRIEDLRWRANEAL